MSNNEFELDYRHLVIGVNDGGRVDPTSLPPPSKNDINEFQSIIGEMLPEDYRRFLEKTNGGSYNPNVVRYLCFDVGHALVGRAEPLSSTQGLDYFYTLADSFLNEKGFPSRVLGLKGSYKSHVGRSDGDWPHTPLEFIPVGITPVESNEFLLGIRGEHRGKVVYYEQNADANQPLENVWHVANNFNDFLSGIYPCE